MSDRITKIVESLLDQAVNAATKSDWQTVARVCSEAIELDPDNSEAARLLGVANSRLKVVTPAAISGSRSPIYRGRNELFNDHAGLAVRMKWAKYTIGATVFVTVVMFFTTLSEISLINDLENSAVPVTQDRIDGNDVLQRLVSLLYLAAYLSSIVAFLLWLKKAYSNLPIIGALDASWTPRWAVGWWFVPFANIFKPYQVMRELWWGSHTKDNRSQDSRNVWPLLGWFWGAHLVSGWLSWASFRTGTDDLASIQTGDYIWLVASVIFVFAGILLFLFVDEVSIGQQSWFDTAYKVDEPESQREISNTDFL